MEKRLRALEAKLSERAAVHRQMHWIARILWAVAGFFILGAGLLMLVLPGPGLLAIAAGLGILALEFAWAQWLLHHGIEKGIRVGSLLTLRRLILALFVTGAIVALAVLIIM